MISWCSFFLPLFFLHVTLQAEDLKVNVSSDKNQTHEEDLIKIMMMDNYSVKQDHKKKLAYFSIWHKPTPSAILKFHEAVDKDHKHEHLKTDEVKMVAFEISDHKFYALYKVNT
ncbi:hypothetical protein HZS_1637 [Henneguya salminicola]|nr:hypothetical protein HZS_1637 [Henneguya salminicola]